MCNFPMEPLSSPLSLIYSVTTLIKSPRRLFVFPFTTVLQNRLWEILSQVNFILVSKDLKHNNFHNELYFIGYEVLKSAMWGMVAHWQSSRCFSTEGSRVRIPLLPSRRDLGQVLHLQLPAAHQHVNSDTMSIAVVGSASKRLIAVVSMTS